jgi:uncharacterized protein (TIGR03437 family)
LGKEKHVKTIRAIVFASGLFSAVAYAQPTIAQISNAASFSLSPLPNSSIAQGSFFAIFGSGLGPSTAAVWKPYPLPTNLGGTTVNVTVGGTTVPAYLYFTLATQINAVLPSTTPTGTGTVTVTYNNQTSATAPIIVVASSFAAFTLNQAGSGPAIISNSSFVLNSLTNTAKPGDEMILFGTGLGPAPDPSTEGTAAPCPDGCNFLTSNPNLVTVWVGSQKVVPDYAGRSQYTAEDEIYFKLPASNATGCYVQVAVQVNPSSGPQVVSNFSSVAVDPTGPTCSDADGINVADIAPVLASKGSANVAAISLLSNYLTLDLGGVENLQWDNDTVNANVGTFTSTVLNESQGFTLSPSVNSCTVSPFQYFPPPSDPALKLETYLDAGGSLSAQGPNGTATVAKNTDGDGYGGLVGGSTIADLLTGSGSPPFYLSSTFGISSGTYTVTGTGGSAVGAFTASIPVSSDAAAFKWTNQAAVATSAIDRTQPLTITWTGGDSTGFVDITAIGSTATAGGGPVKPNPPIPGTPGVLVECLAQASAGTFTIPPFVLSALPSTQGSASLIPVGELLVGPASGAVKLSTVPSGLDAAYIFYHFIQGLNVGWK